MTWFDDSTRRLKPLFGRRRYVLGLDCQAVGGAQFDQIGLAGPKFDERRLAMCGSNSRPLGFVGLVGEIPKPNPDFLFELGHFFAATVSGRARAGRIEDKSLARFLVFAVQAFEQTN